MKKFKTIFGTVFGGIGLLFFIIGINLIIDAIEFKEIAVSVPAVITDINEIVTRDSDGDRHISHDVYVRYTYEGVIYNDELNEYSSSMKVGKEIPVLIDPNYPSEAQYEKMVITGPLIFTGIGGLFFCIGLGFIISLIKEFLLKSKAKREGTEIYATITDMREDKSVTINGYHPIYLVCEYENNNINYKFKSESRMDFKDDVVGRQIRVYYIDEKQYYVDIKYLKENL